MSYQKTITLARRGKGCHIIQNEIEREISDGLSKTKCGLLNVFVHHTSCGLSLNENADPDVRKDMDMALDKIVPESLPWRHLDEGLDDSYV